MSDIQLYLLEVDKNKTEARQIAASSARKLESKELKLIELITSLEEYINNKEDGSLRARSVSYMADVLEQVGQKALSGQERRLLCDFVLGRMEGDVEGIGASARALLALEDRGRWDPDLAQRVMRTIIDNTHPLRQFKLQTDRYPVIQLVNLLLAKYRTAVKKIHDGNPQFMEVFISYFEGEKDPRNLMVIFSFLQVPMAEWDIQATAQDLFESVFNYFPITFKPPPDDPYGITAQDLKDRLRDCIAANSNFAPYAFPALLDKLDSTSMNTKRDVLQAIQACSEGYGINTMNLYSVTLWDALKFEVLNVQEDDLAQAALHALYIIAKKFAQAEGPLKSFLRPIIKESNERLEDAPTKQSAGAGRILYSVSKAGSLVADKIVKGVLPPLFQLYQSSESIAKRRGLLEVLNQIIKAYLESQTGGTSADIDGLKTFSDIALDAMTRALVKAPKAEVSFRLTALSGLAQIVSINGLLSDAQTAHAIDAVNDIILHERIEGHGDIRAEAIQALIQMAHAVPEVVRQEALPTFMVELPEVPDDRISYRPVLEAFAQLSVEQQIFDTIVLRIKNKLATARKQGASKEYQRALLLAMLYAFTHGAPSREGGVVRDLYFTDYIEPLVTQLQDALPSQRDDLSTEVVGRLTNIILRQQTPHFQCAIYNKILEWLSPSAISTTSFDAVKTYAPFSLYFYAAIKPEIAEPMDIVSLLRAQAASLLGSGQNVVGTRTILRHLSLLVNKFLQPTAMEQLLIEAGVEVETLLRDSVTEQKKAIAFAIVKALVVQGRCGQLTSRYLKLLLDKIATENQSFARRFSGILAPDDILTKENHCVVSGLYKQKTFGQTVPSIIESVRTAPASAKPNHLIALSGILRWLPYSMVQPSLSALAPLLLHSLDLSDPADQEVKYSTLILFESILMHDAAVASEHSASLITRLLNSTSTSGNLAKVRAKALQCLSLVPRQLKTETVVPYRRPVVKKLLGCLDDGKRMVRSEAVRCRSAWLALEEGNEDEE